MDGLHWADYLVFVCFLLVSVGIGAYHALTGGRQRTTAEFIMANRKLKVVPTMLSLSMSVISAIMVLGVSGEVYSYGIMFLLWANIGTGLGIFIVQQLIIVWLFPVQLTSAFEYLERRFHSKAARGTASFMGIFAGVLYMGVAMFAPSIALEAVTGVPTAVSIPVMAVIATLYTALGGMKAVIWTDVFQGIVMLIGLFAVLIRSWVLVGVERAYDVASAGGRIYWTDFSVDPRVRHSSWSLMFGLMSTFLFMFGVNQASVQRFSATKNQRDSRLSIILSIPFIILLQVVTGIAGVNVYSYFVDVRCDPFLTGHITSNSQVLPYFVKLAFEDYKGFTGLLLSILYSGALSSVSSSLSGCAANIWEDALKSILTRRLTELQAALFNKFLVVVVGAMGMVIALVCQVLPGTLIQLAMAFFGVCGGPLVGMFLLGGLSRKATWQGAVVGGWTAFVFVMWLLVGAQINNVHSIDTLLPSAPTDGCAENVTVALGYNESTNSTLTASIEASETRGGITNFYMLSYMWYQPMAIAITLIVGMLVSFIARYFDPSQCDMKVEEVCLINWSNVFSLNLDGTMAKAPNHTDTVRRYSLFSQVTTVPCLLIVWLYHTTCVCCSFTGNKECARRRGNRGSGWTP